MNTEKSITEAKKINPIPYLESQGLFVKKIGKSFSVQNGKEEVYRIDFKDNKWIWTDKYASKGGDNIDLVRDIEGIGFKEAINRLIGNYNLEIQRQKEPSGEEKESGIKYPKIPPYTKDTRQKGIEYLNNRGISLETIEYAENKGFLRLIECAVVFLGRDENERIRNATRRATDPNDPVQKRDFLNSDKNYPAIIKGRLDRVWIVEGGVDALALIDVHIKNQKILPTIIVSGGIGIKSYLDNIQNMLKKTESIIIACENEKDSQTQAKTDELRAKLITKIKDITNTTIKIWLPIEAKDLAEWHLKNKEIKNYEIKGV